MNTCRLQDARRVRKLALALGMLSICCLALPTFAQEPELGAALPNAPSAGSIAPAVGYGSSTATTGHSLTLGERAHVYAHSIFSPMTIIGPAFGAGISQGQDVPSGWSQSAEGYGKRFGTGVARQMMAETIRFAVAAADREDTRYFRSENRGVFARTRHAVASTLFSKTSSGATIPAFSRFVGIYGASFIAGTWYPDNQANAREAAVRGSTALGASVALHVLREFMPHRNSQ